MINVATKLRRTVHVMFDMALTDPERIDLELTPNEGDTLTLLTFIDQEDQEAHVYVLNNDFRERLIQALSGGVSVATPAEVSKLVLPHLNGG